MRLSGKVGLVTGGASGIGASTAKAFADEGAKVVIADIQDAMSERLVRELREGGADAIYFHLDVTDEDNWRRAVDAALAAFGRLDVLVNNAGIGGRRDSGGSELDNWNQVMAVNATGPFLGVKAVLEPMKKIGGGSVINISSIYGIVGPTLDPHLPPTDAIAGAYNASKGSIRLLSKAAALQLSKYNIRVNSVHPGFIDTPLTARAFSYPETKEHLRRLHPIGRLGKPEDVANAVLYLASDEASFVTGAELVVDGGYTAQ
ncbi:MAG: glucose 1-dehydrogenase [Dehalococcoidia bacterium]|nr:glucose 1-dehydrogenase [Dehalococcoidia bacterium]